MEGNSYYITDARRYESTTSVEWYNADKGIGEKSVILDCLRRGEVYTKKERISFSNYHAIRDICRETRRAVIYVLQVTDNAITIILHEL